MPRNIFSVPVYQLDFIKIGLGVSSKMLRELRARGCGGWRELGFCTCPIHTGYDISILSGRRDIGPYSKREALIGSIVPITGRMMS